ncbi:MAG TPA: hypothetical protein VKV77_03225 [Methylovirgula sp.]|nr:hypothetical protein [Methylovirgula sp.]
MVKIKALDLRLPVALGSGLATTLLLVSFRQGTLPALIVASLSPLPLMIATLGFGHATGLGAAAIAALTFTALMAAAFLPHNQWVDAIVTAGLSGLVFAICLALPAWWLARLAGLNRLDIALPWTARRNGKSSDYYPVGLIVCQAALIGFAIVALATLIVSLGQTSFDSAAARMAPLVVQAFSPYELPNHFDPVVLARLIIRAMPPLFASLILLVFVLNLWFAGRIVQISDRLTRPWPDIPHELRVPRLLGLVLAAACALCLLGGIAGLVASAATAVLVILFALQGLCVIHDLSRGAKFRGALLCGVYVTFVLLTPWPLAVFTIIGLVEAGFSLRDRKAAAAASHN